jgi:cytosine deaminase
LTFAERAQGAPAVIDLLLADATLEDGERADVAIAGEDIESVTAAGSGPRAQRRIDLGGALLSPAFVDGHIHLDKCFTGVPWRPHRPASSLAERIAIERRQLAEADTELSRIDRAEALVRQIVAYGTGHVRSHVDIDPISGLANLHAVLELRERTSDVIGIQIVAFPQSGILAAPGTADLLDAALREGADVIGGLDPATFDGDRARHLDVVFGLADRYDVPVDIHLHEEGPVGCATLRAVAERTLVLGMQGRVAVSHGYALGSVGSDEFARTAEALQEAGVAVVTNAPGHDPMPPVRRLRAAGVAMFAGSDNIRDSWWPYGNGDMLERATLIGYLEALYTDAELAVAHEMTTADAARALGVARYGLAPGMRADLVAIAAGSVAEAVATHPPRLLTVHAGRVVASPAA